MGFSAGGYSALILPLLHPNIWGVVGTNDACVWMACTINGAPEGVLVDVFRNANLFTHIDIQLGTAISPNPNVPLRFDWPITADVRKKWDAYCLWNRETVVQHRKTLINLLEIVLIVPEETSGSCRNHNSRMIQQMETAGISVTRLDWRGGHGTDNYDRFIALAERVVKAMPKGVSVDPKGKLATGWSQIKSMK
jgi:hypothetical protein